MCGQNLHVKNFPNQNSQPQEKHRCFMDLCKVELLHKDRKNYVGHLEIMWVTKLQKIPRGSPKKHESVNSENHLNLV